MKRTIITTALAAVLALPTSAMALPGFPVKMTDQGLRQWVQQMPDDEILANRLGRVIAECDCDEMQSKKALVEYFTGLFSHHGYSYGETVVEYLDAIYGEGQYEYEGSKLLQPSGMVHFVMPAIGLIQDGEKDWLVSSGSMRAEAAWLAEDALQRHGKL